MPRATKTIGLPLSKELRSADLEAVQHHFELFKTALDDMYKRLLSDITTIKIGDGTGIIVGDWIYFGDKDTDDSWRIGREDNNWVGQRRESSVWTPSKGKITP